MPERWRVGRKVPINIYEGENPGRPICQVHNEEDARRIVGAVNATLPRFSWHAWTVGGCANCGVAWTAAEDHSRCPGRPDA